MRSLPDDRNLVARAKAGDRPAFSSLLERHYPALLKTCRRALPDPDLAHDAAQQAAVAAMLGLDRLRDEDRFAAWLIGIGLNLCRGLMRERRRLIPVEQFETELSGGSSGVPSPALHLESIETAAEIRSAISQLPAGQRRAVTLFYLAGMTQAARRPALPSCLVTLENLITRDGAICVWCGREPWRSDLTAEHLLPRTRHGRRTPENLAVACRACNKARRTKAVAAYVREQLDGGRQPRVDLLSKALERLSTSPSSIHSRYGERQLALLGRVATALR